MGVKYKEIAEILQDDIINGKYKEKSKLPTVEELMKDFNVSKNTLRAAIELLVDKGYIYQVQGSGIFVRPTSRDGYINITNMRGITTDFKDHKVESKILDFKIITADEELAEKMRCEIGTEIYNVKRLRIMDGQPFSIEDSFFNKDLVPYLNNEIIQNSIYKYIKTALKLTIGFADKIICCEKLSAEEADLIGVNEGEATLVIENTVYLTNGLIFDVSRSKYNYNNTKLISVANYR